MGASKPFQIPKQRVMEAYRIVKANDGAPGVDEASIAEFEARLEDNLYKLWNRMSSGSYLPPPVRKVEIPKAGGRGVRVLGVPTVTDRIAQTVVKLTLEPEVEPLFHADSYGYRPGRSALDAVGVCRKRCWEYDWVIDLDIQAFFDSIPHDLVRKAVARHTELRWVQLYIERWLRAPLQERTGTLVEREQGSPQGSAISPLLANLFLHYAFDTWIGQARPETPFERYCDDIVVHCRSEEQARAVLAQITERLANCGLVVNQEKTRIVYCRDDRRSGRHEHEQFDFLGYTFRRRRCKSGRDGSYFNGFNPAISDQARSRLAQTIRQWRLQRRSSQTLTDLAQMINPLVRGWTNYYGRYFPSRFRPILKRINDYLARWVQRKYKRLQRRPHRAWRFLADVAGRNARLFAHWAIGLVPKAG